MLRLGQQHKHIFLARLAARSRIDPPPVLIICNFLRIESHKVGVGEARPSLEDKQIAHPLQRPRRQMGIAYLFELIGREVLAKRTEITRVLIDTHPSVRIARKQPVGNGIIYKGK